MAVPVFSDAVAFATDPVAAYVDQLLGLSPGVYLRLGDTVGSGTAADASGNGNTGTVTGGVTFGQPGFLPGDTDTAALFDGSTGTISVPFSSTWKPTSAVTALAVINLAALPSIANTAPVLSAVGSFFVQVGSDGTVTYEVSPPVGADAVATAPASALVPGTAYFVVATDDGTTMSIYINGALVVSAPRTLTGWETGSTSLTLAKQGTAFMHGTLDEVAVVKDVAITAAQVAQLYAARTGTPTSQIGWTTLTGKPRTISVTRGKQHELDVTQAGTANSQLLNTGREFDPTNTSSPYSPHILPLRRFRRRATINSTTYNIFQGYVTRWPQVRTGPTYADVPLQAIDGFEPLSQAVLVGSFPQELSGARINRVLNAAAWPQADRSVDAGASLMQAVTFAATAKKTALSHIQEIEQSERGWFFIGGNGQATFIDRHSLLTSPYNTSQQTFSDKPGGGEFGYQQITVSYDRDQIFNDWSDTRTGGTAQNAQDAASIQAYFRRSQSLTSQLASDSESLLYVQWLLSLYKDPLFRVDSIVLRPGSSTGFWQAVLARELGDRITVKGSPPGGGPQFVKDCLIAQTNMNTPTHAADTTVTWQLVSADTTKYLILDDPVQGQLDGNKVAW